MPEVPEVLVVDDEELIRLLVQGMLEGEGWYVRTAPNGAAAGEILYAWRPDLVISDVEMPEANGIQLLDTVRENLGVTPFILMSASEVHADEAFAHGANAFIAKPFDVSSLLDTVRRVMEQQQ